MRTKKEKKQGGNVGLHDGLVGALVERNLIMQWTAYRNKIIIIIIASHIYLTTSAGAHVTRFERGGGGEGGEKRIKSMTVTDCKL